MIGQEITMAEVIDRIFHRLLATYGVDWSRQWATVPIADVKNAWAHELAGYVNHLQAISYAFENLPERCPNAIQFRNLCRAAPAKPVTTLETPRADLQRVNAELEKFNTVPAPVKTDGRDWARRIMVRHASGEKIMPYTLKCAQLALHDCPASGKKFP